jgi:hypothetical protein
LKRFHLWAEGRASRAGNRLLARTIRSVRLPAGTLRANGIECDCSREHNLPAPLTMFSGGLRQLPQ